MNVPVCDILECGRPAMYTVHLGTRQKPGPSVHLCTVCVGVAATQRYNIVEIIEGDLSCFCFQEKDEEREG